MRRPLWLISKPLWDLGEINVLTLSLLFWLRYLVRRQFKVSYFTIVCYSDACLTYIFGHLLGKNSSVSLHIINAQRCTLLIKFLMVISRCCTAFVSYHQHRVQNHIMSEGIIKMDTDKALSPLPLGDSALIVSIFMIHSDIIWFYTRCWWYDTKAVQHREITNHKRAFIIWYYIIV